jgi:hypothetical protein
MNTVRRLYLYLVSLFSVLIAMLGLIQLAGGLASGRVERELVAFNAALLAVSLPVYAFHYVAAQRAVRRGVDGGHDAARKFYFYAAMFSALLVGGTAVYLLTSRLLVAALGVMNWPSRERFGEPLAAALVAVLFWLYHRYLAARDRAVSGDETDPGALWARLYLYLAGAIGLAVFAFGLAELLRSLLLLVLSGSASSKQILTYRFGIDSTRILVGGTAWVIHWLVAERRFTLNVAEQRSVVRKGYLYLAVLASAVAALTSATLLLRDGLRLLMGAPRLETAVLVGRLANPLAVAAVGTIFWIYHWRALSRDMAETPEAPRQAGIRRLYYYLVSGVGLALVAWGMAHLMGALIAFVGYRSQQVLGAQLVFQFGPDWFREQVSLNVALLLVGIPVWVRHWRTMDVIAAKTAGRAGALERRALLRKTYLYLVVFIGAIVLLSQPAEFLFRLLNVLLGAPMPADFWDKIGGQFSNSVVAGVMWLYHWFVLRRDQQLGEAAIGLEEGEAAPAVLVVDTESGEMGCEVVRQLTRALPGVRIIGYGRGDPARLAFAECAASSADDLLDALSEATVVVAPLMALLPDSTGSMTAVAEALVATRVPRVIIPSCPGGVVVAGVRASGRPALARAAVRAVAKFLESAGSDSSTGEG